MSSPDLGSVPRSPDFTLSVDSAQSLSSSLVAEISAFCDHIEDADGARTALIRLHGTGTGENWPGAVGIHLVSRWEKALRRLERAQLAKIAIAEGICSGPALEVLLTSDYRIGAAGLRVDVPVSNHGVWAGMIVHRLVSQCGGTRARQLVLFGAELSAEQAAAIGLIDETVDDPAAAVMRLAERFTRVAPAELAIRRRLVLEASETSFEDALGMHLAACARTLRRHHGEPASPPALR